MRTPHGCRAVEPGCCIVMLTWELYYSNRSCALYVSISNPCGHTRSSCGHQHAPSKTPVGIRIYGVYSLVWFTGGIVNLFYMVSVRSATAYWNTYCKHQPLSATLPSCVRLFFLQRPQNSYPSTKSDHSTARSLTLSTGMPS